MDNSGETIAVAARTGSVHEAVAAIVAMRRAGAFDQARRALATAWADYPGAVDVMIEAARLSTSCGDVQAPVLWEEAVRLHPAHGPVWLARAQSLRDAGDRQGALAVLAAAEAHAAGFVWCWFERLDLAASLGDDALCFAVWRGLRRALPEAEPVLQRGWAVRLLWRQREPEALRDLLSLLLEQKLEEGPGVPALWLFAKELQMRAHHGWHEDGPGAAVRAALAPLLAESRRHGALHAAIFHLPLDPVALAEQGWALLAGDRAILLGCLREINESVGRALIGSFAYLGAAVPDSLLPVAQLELLRLALAECPDGADALLRRWRAALVDEATAGPDDETTPQGAIAALCARLRTRGEAPPAAPALHTGRALRIALCVSGQLRGYRLAYSSWQGFNAGAHEMVTIVHSWRHIGRRQLGAPGFIVGRLFPPAVEAVYNRAWSELGGLAGIIARYPELNALFEARDMVNEAQLSAHYQTPHVVLEDDTAPAFADFTNQDKMFYKIAAAQALADDMGEFDLVVRLRPDKELRWHGTPDWLQLAAESVRRRELYNDSGAHYVMSGLGVGDQFALGAADLMRDYASVWAARDTLKPYGAPAAIEAHSSLAHHLYARGIRVRVWPGLWGGRLFDAEPVPPAELAAAVRRDLAARVPDALDMALLESCAGLDGG